MSRLFTSRGITALAVALAAGTGIACAAVSTAAATDSPSRRSAVVPFADPSPSESPCPGGEPKPCAAGEKDRDEVEGKQEQIAKDEAQAKKDMDAAKEKANECPPTSKECMTALTGDGAEQKEGMAEARKELAGVHPAPSGNAASAVSGACNDFAADLPPALVSSDPEELTRVCELMNS